MTSRPARVLAVVVAVGLVLALGACSDGGGDGGDATPAGAGSATSTTLNAGDIAVDAPDGWQAIPVPDLGFGLAVPPGWESTLLSTAGLATLAGSSPAVPDFKELAHAAAQQGGLLYAAGVDKQKGVSDVVVRGTPNAGITDAAGLQRYALDLAKQAGRPDQEVTVVPGTKHPTVRLRFEVGGTGAGEAGPTAAQATETLVAGPNDVVWDVTVTSDDATSHDELARRISDTFTLGAAKPAG